MTSDDGTDRLPEEHAQARPVPEKPILPSDLPTMMPGEYPDAPGTRRRPSEVPPRLPPPRLPPPPPPPPRSQGPRAFPPPPYVPQARGRRLLWLWLTLAAVLLLLVAAATSLAVVRPWEGEDGSASMVKPGATEPEASAAPDPSRDAVTGDVDGDGYGDLVAVLSDGAEEIRKVTWTSDGSRLDAREETIGTFEDRVWADWDGDGDLTDLTWESGDGRLAITAADASFSGSFDGFGAMQDAPYVTLDPADVDGDGDPDLVAGGQTGETSSTLWVLSNDGLRFGEPEVWAELPNAGRRSTGVHPADFDGDGRDDLLAQLPAEPVVPGQELYEGTFGLALLRSTGAGFDVGDVVPDPRLGFNAVAVGDFAGSGEPTVLRFAAADDTLTLVANTYDGAVLVPLWELTVPLAAGAHVSAIKVTDVDGDGAADVAFVQKAPADRGFVGGVQVVRSTGSGFKPASKWGESPVCATPDCYLYFLGA